MNKNCANILPLARLIRRLATAALALGALAWIWASWMLASGQADTRIGPVHAGFAMSGDTAASSQALSPGLAWLAGSAALAVTAFGLVRLIQLMRIYEAGRIFDPRASHLLASFAAAIFLRQLIDVAAPPMLSFLAHLAGGRGGISFHIGSTQMHGLFVTIIFVLIANIMAAAHRLADDNAKII